MDDKLYALVEGNPGAINVVAQLCEDEWDILEKHQCIGSKIWILYKYSCNQNIEELKKILAAPPGEPILHEGKIIFT